MENKEKGKRKGERELVMTETFVFGILNCLAIIDHDST